MPDPNTGYCHLCDAPLTPGHLDAILDHVRVIHPDQWGDGPERWPDDGLVYDDTTADAALAAVNFGADFSSTAGTFTVQWHASGIFTIS